MSALLDQLFIESIDEICVCVNLASLLEVSGWPKPGNVHRTSDFEETRYEHFLASIAAIQPEFRKFCEKVYKYSINIGEDYSFVRLGEFFKCAANQSVKWQKGGNVLLGHLLILAPIVAAATISLKSQKLSYKTFKFNLEKVINDATTLDTVNLYKAIEICDPGGLGKVDKYDIRDPDSIPQIKKHNVSLKEIFDLSKDYDNISFLYAKNYEILLNEWLPYFIKTFEQTEDINITIVNTFLRVLSDCPDTLIVRKSGEKAAKEVQEEARLIIKNGGAKTREGLDQIRKLDEKLHEKKGKMNPGTSADILAGIILCALLFGLRF